MQDSILTQIGAFALNSRLAEGCADQCRRRRGSAGHLSRNWATGRAVRRTPARSGPCKTACMSSRATRCRGGSCCGRGRTAAGLPSARPPRSATRSPATARFMRSCRSLALAPCLMLVIAIVVWQSLRPMTEARRTARCPALGRSRQALARRHAPRTASVHRLDQPTAGANPCDDGAAAAFRCRRRA